MASGQYQQPTYVGNPYPLGYGAPSSQPHRHKSVGGLVTLIILFMLTLLGGGLFIIVQFFGTIIHDTFGDCSNTPRAAAALYSAVEHQDMRVVAVEYDCSRSATAVVDKDVADLYIATEVKVASPEELQQAMIEALAEYGWTGAGTTLSQGGYWLEVKVHSYQPALAHLRLERKELGSESHSSWDNSKQTLDSIDFSPEDIQRYALLPLYVPTYVPEGYPAWDNGYNVFTEYGFSTRIEGQGTVPLVHVKKMAPQCGVIEACTVVKELSNGMTLYKVGEVDRDAQVTEDGYINGDYVVFVDGVAITYSEARSYDNGKEFPVKPLEEDEIIKIFESVEKRSPAPAK